MVVDVKIKIGDETVEFKQLNANASIANSGNVVVSDSRGSHERRNRRHDA